MAVVLWVVLFSAVILASLYFFLGRSSKVGPRDEDEPGAHGRPSSQPYFRGREGKL